MKTVGEIFKSRRLAKNLSLKQVEEEIKIREKFLEAIEENNWHLLPSLIYARGFIKNYADFLDLDVNYVLSIFRRQLANEENIKILPSNFSFSESIFKITPQKVLGIFILSLIIFFFFLLFNQYQTFRKTPFLTLEEPKENEILKTEKLIIKGKTSPQAEVFINGQKIIINQDGSFFQEIFVNSGIFSFEVIAVKKDGGKSIIKRTVKIESP